ncbi:MAG TPA: L-histidine N(alpha)-methyltransferase [Stellaceae bacterium]|jgi:dimethylhistidine N-methyltransferase|nr:L-histidine N(alpha)-methyltransferase [Stellaceae bacterium]
MDGVADFAFHDLAPGQESFRDAVLTGLSRDPKSLPCKFFYDSRGSELFEEICKVPEYYLTRTEIAILDEYADDIATRLGPHCRLIELGSGASIKVRILLQALDRPAAYVPVDISGEHLRDAAAQLAADFPELPVIAVCADYTRSFQLPPLAGPAGKRVGFFPGSTIGNFEPEAVVRFLRNCAELLGPGGEMLIGADLKKEPDILEAAYNDRAGMNAAFNLNLLERINRELGGNLDIDRFEHVAFFNPDEGRMELYIKSLAAQSAAVAGRDFRFAAGEMIHTENSYKYAIDEFRALATRAGFKPIHTWTDKNDLFSVHYLRQE